MKYRVRQALLVSLLAASFGAGVAIAETTDAHEAPTDPPAATPGPLPTPVPLLTPSQLPPCENEDGPGPCVWDAREMGNGRGLSFWITCDQVIHYFDAKAERKFGGEHIDYPNRCN